MLRSPRVHRFCKWGGLGVSILLAVGWAASLAMTVIVSHSHLHVAVASGGFGFAIPKHPIEMETRFVLVGPESIRWLPSVGPKRWGLPDPTPRPNLMFTGYVPFWCLFPLAAIPTVILWRRDRRIPPGHCQTCGYDLTGNTTGVCSECGTTADSHAADSAR